MGKCVCPNPKSKSLKKRQAPSKSKKAGGCGKGKGKGHPANMFILYFLDTWKKNGGNMYCVAKDCGKKWKSLPQAEKDKYKRQYCSKCRNCKSCTRKKC